MRLWAGTRIGHRTWLGVRVGRGAFGLVLMAASALMIVGLLHDAGWFNLRR